MKSVIAAFVLFILTGAEYFAQGTIRGKITDELGEAIIGAPIILKSNKQKGTTTDLDGNYSLTVPDSLPQILVISYVSLQTIEEAIQAKKGEVLIRNFSMTAKEFMVTGVVIEGKAVRNKDTYLENIKKKSATSIDYISSETMKKTGDNNVTSAVARVSGVSTNGNFITVRGIGDRYLKTNINGFRIPTLDPFTNNIKLDLFPSALVDNIIITKTASPDLPGDWAGAYLSVETKDYPDALSINIETTVTYNAQTTGKDYLSTQRSPTDWLGFDNGSREVDHQAFVTVNATPTQFQEFRALGLGNYFAGLGINENSPWNETFTKLGLVQLGLLDKARFYDNDAYLAASNAYESGQYGENAFASINKTAAVQGQRFPNNWDTQKRKGPVNFTQGFTIGNQVLLFGKPLGFIAGFRYGSSVLNDPGSIAQRAAVDANGEVNVARAISQHVSRETNGISGILNLSFKPNPNNSVSLLFMPNFNGNNNVRNDSERDFYESVQNIYSKVQFYEEREQIIYQLKTDHYFPASKVKLDVNASYTRGKSSVPDFKAFDYFLDLDGFLSLERVASNTSRFYRYLNEDLFDSRVSAEIPIGDKPGLSRKLKFGGAYQRNERRNDQYNYLMRSTIPDKYIIENNNIDPFFGLDNFAINSENQIISFYERDENPGNKSIGYSQIIAGFGMIDYSISTALRISGGFRIEDASIYTDVFAYDSLGYAPNDGRRFFPGGIISLAPNPGDLKELSFLPSINVIYNLGKNDEAPKNLRLNFSKTVARPSIRELSEIIVFDYELRSPVFGNSDLKMVEIYNYDLRFESYFKSGDNISVSAFYKDFKNHIELVTSNIGFSWQNVDNSRVIGIEIEGKKQILKNLEFRANISLVNSRSEFVAEALQLNNGIKTYIPFDTLNRSMFGQAPYVLNGILSYAMDSLGLTATVSYNRQGPRLVIAAISGTPDIYEVPRNLLDFKFSKSLGKHFSMTVTIRDILNSPIRRTYTFEDGRVIDFDRFTYGTNYQLGIQYRF